MKKPFILLLCLLTALCLTVPALGEGVSRTVSVSGSANVSLAADTATLRIGVSTVRDTVAEAQSENNEIMQRVIAAILGLSALSSLSSLLGLFPPTSDLNVVAGWAILVFILITYYKLQGGLWPYVKGFFTPVPLFAPMNVLGEIATPVSMSFRHYGNVLSGVIISALVGAALRGLSHTLLGWLPGVLGQFPFLQIGLPAILSLYFDIFSGCMQAFIFAMLTMLNIALGFPEEDYERRQAKKRKKASLQKA